jgi:hypothetical protein
MAKIAIDVALFLPERVNEICISINQADPGRHSDLSKADNHPHITLVMGVLDEKYIKEASRRISKVVAKHKALNLKIIELNFHFTPEHKKSFQFIVSRTEELVKLHVDLMEALFPLLTYKVENDMFQVDDDETFAEVSKFWVENYDKKYHHPRDYHPHISLKCKKAEPSKLSIGFKATKVAMCQQGNYCTCRKILFESDLSPF